MEGREEGAMITQGRRCVFTRQARLVDSYFTSFILSFQGDMFGPAFSLTAFMLLHNSSGLFTNAGSTHTSGWCPRCVLGPEKTSFAAPPERFEVSVSLAAN